MLLNALDTGESATDVFTYTLSDGGSGTATATITITILGENDTPTAGNETVYINENNARTLVVMELELH